MRPSRRDKNGNRYAIELGRRTIVNEGRINRRRRRIVARAIEGKFFPGIRHILFSLRGPVPLITPGERRIRRSSKFDWRIVAARVHQLQINSPLFALVSPGRPFATDKLFP